MSESDNEILDDDEPIAMGGKPKSDDEIDMTPMIDVTFLLLIFFVVTSDMNPEKAATLPEARNGGTVSINDACVVQILAGQNDVPDVVVGDDRHLSQDPDALEVELGDFLRAEMDRGKSSVVLQGDGNAPVGQIGIVRRIVSETLQDSIDQIHIAVMDKR